jgi:amino acid adenylation domain-containing protein
VRWYLLRLGEHLHELIMCLHHIASDGWSESVLDRELATLYAAYRRGDDDPLPALPLQYADYAAWQRNGPENGSGSEMDWWQRQLAGAPAGLALPADRRAGVDSSFEGAHLICRFPPDLVDRLTALCEQESATMFMALLAGLAATLARLSGQDDLVIGAPAAGRLVPEVECLIGLFINTIALRIDTSGRPGLRELLRRVRQVTLDAYSHQDVPLEQVVERLAPAREPGRQPLVQVMFQVYNVPEYRLELPGVKVDRRQLLSSGGSALDLTLSVAEHSDADGLGALWEYRSALFDAGTVQRLHDCLVWLLTQAAADPQAPFAGMQLMPAQQQLGVLDLPADPGRALPPVHRMFEERARAVPRRLAVAAPGQSLSYAELDAGADHLAGRLAGAGVRPGDLVGICLERTPAMVASVLAVLKAGAAYLPLDPGHPPARLAGVIADARPVIVLADAASAGSLPASSVPLMNPDDRAPAASTRFTVPDPDPRDLAYVIYTSGSTGSPKGVAVTHGALAGYLLAAKEAYDPGGELDSVLHSPLAFDFTVTPLFLPLLSGRTVSLATGTDPLGDLARILAEAGRSPYAVKLTPAHLAALRERLAGAAVAGAAALFIIGGDQLLADEITAWRQLAPRARFVNEYGPTEATVGCVVHQVTEDRLGRASVPIGRAMPGMRAYVLDLNLHPMPPGVAGELYLAGRGIARGYLGRPSLTAERFGPDPFGGEPGAIMYRTGDLVRRRSDGLLEYLGRTDRQVKIRGYRTELGEVEAALLGCAGVAQAIVVTSRDGHGDHALISYVVSEPGQQAPDPAALRSKLAGTLPSHLIPAAFVRLDELPLTPNGKIDHARLPVPGRESRDAGASYASPASRAEHMIADIWRRALNTDRVGADDDFFILGGHSVLASAVAAEIAAALGADSTEVLRALFRDPTVAGVAAALASRPERRARPRAEHARPRRDGPLPLTEAQEGLWFIDRLMPDSCEYLVPMAWWLDGPLDIPALRTALMRVVDRHEVLRMAFVEENGRPAGRLLDPSAVRLAVCDLPDAEELLLAEATTPLDLAAGPPMRVVLGRVSSARHLLCVTVHHLVFDGWSQAVLLSDLAAAYQAAMTGDPTPWQPLTFGFADYAAAERDPGRRHERSLRLDHWAEVLAAAPPLDLPTDRPRPPYRLGHGDACAFTVDPALVTALDRLGRDHGATPLMVLAAALGAFLHRWTGAQDITIGTSAGDRFDPDTHDLIGFFVTMLALRGDLSGDPSFAELLRRTRAVALDAYAHQDVPFQQVVERLAELPDLSRTPVFQVALDYESTISAAPCLGQVRLAPCQVPPTVAKYDLGMTFRRDGDWLGCELEFDTDLFDTGTARRIGEAFGVLLGDALRRPRARLSELAAPTAELGRRWSPEPVLARAAVTAEPPATDAERTIARIWEEVLDVRGLGRHDGFFESGGRSLLAVRAIAMMRQSFGTTLPLDLLFKHSTVARAAAEVERVLLAEIDEMTEETAAELLRTPDRERTH